MKPVMGGVVIRSEKFCPKIAILGVLRPQVFFAPGWGGVCKCSKVMDFVTSRKVMDAVTIIGDDIGKVKLGDTCLLKIGQMSVVLPLIMPL